MITANALCDDRAWMVKPKDVFNYAWGSAVICCDACRSVAMTRDSWMEVYGW